MPSLLEVQAAFSRAVRSGHPSWVVNDLTGGQEPAARLAIHRRHYRVSLRNAILDRFPATTWLIGSTRMDMAASAFVETHPPAEPCIAEYGAQFPRFLQGSLGPDLEYVEAFAELEWHLAQAAIAGAAQPALSWNDVVSFGPERLQQARARLPLGVHYMGTVWGVDELIRAYVGNTPPAQFSLSTGEVWLQIHGSRGDLSIQRLDRHAWLFRSLLKKGLTLGDAAVRMLEEHPSADVGTALRSLVSEGLVTQLYVEGDMP